MTAGYPAMDYNMTLNELLYIFMFTKLYIIFRYIINSSIYTNTDAKFLWYILHIVVWLNMISMLILAMHLNA